MIAPENQNPESAPVTEPSSDATIWSTVQTTAPAATATDRLSKGRADMAARMPYRSAGREKATVASASMRLHQMFGDSPATWENRMYGAASCYQRVAQINGALRALGLEDKLAELMLPVEMSLAGAPVPDALHRENLTDAEEDVLQEAFRFHPSEQTARALLRKRAVSRAASLDHDREIAERFGIAL